MLRQGLCPQTLPVVAGTARAAVAGSAGSAGSAAAAGADSAAGESTVAAAAETGSEPVRHTRRSQPCRSPPVETPRRRGQC